MRVMWGSFVFFAFLTIVMFGVKSGSDVRAGLQNGFVSKMNFLIINPDLSL